MIPRELESKYMLFEQAVSNRKTKVVLVSSKSSGVELGWIKWYGAWRQYCFYPATDTIFSKGCLQEIEEYITALMDERKK